MKSSTEEGCLLKRTVERKNSVKKVEEMEGKTEEINLREEPFPGFNKYDRPFLGIPMWIIDIIKFGIITQTCMFYYFFYLWPKGIVPRASIFVTLIYGTLCGLGITVASHRYFTHRSFKANKPLQYLLMLMQTSTFQGTILWWCSLHRVHHKYVDTNGDPHSAGRGFWFSHMLWLFQPHHPEVMKGLRTIDVRDLQRDPVVSFQTRHYWKLLLLTFLIIPMTLYKLFFPQMTLFECFVTNMARHGGLLHITFLINSVGHYWGDKPYDKWISATDNKWLTYFVAGDGYHNYHHTFPWDYNGAEFGRKRNLSSSFIHFFVWLGWASDLKTVSHKLLLDRIKRTGDGSSPTIQRILKREEEKKEGKEEGHHHHSTYWGWGDKTMQKEDFEVTKTLYSQSRREVEAEDYSMR